MKLKDLNYDNASYEGLEETIKEIKKDYNALMNNKSFIRKLKKFQSKEAMYKANFDNKANNE